MCFIVMQHTIPESYSTVRTDEDNYKVQSPSIHFFWPADMYAT